MQDIATKRLLYVCPGIDRVTVQRDLEFRGADGGALLMDIYSPPDADSQAPTVVIAAGYRDEGFHARLGCRFKDMGSSVSWAEAIAASGMRAVTYTNRQPAADFQAVLTRLRQDTDRIGVWASSGNAATALSAVMRDAPAPVVCAALLYGFTLDLEWRPPSPLPGPFTWTPTATGPVSNASKDFGFAVPCSGRGIDDLRADVPVFLARAGQDQFPGLNDALDTFVMAGLAANLPLTVVNHPDGPHAFDLFHDSDTTRAVACQILQFLRLRLVRRP